MVEQTRAAAPTLRRSEIRSKSLHGVTRVTCNYDDFFFSEGSKRFIQRFSQWLNTRYRVTLPRYWKNGDLAGQAKGVSDKR